MNKRKVEALLSIALDVLDKCGIKNEDGSISKVYRGYISTFCASITMGNLKMAVAFLSADTDSTKGERDKLLCAVHYILNKEDFDNNIRPTAKHITNTILKITDKETLYRLKEDYINASLAIKSVLAAFDLNKDKEE